MRKDRELKGMNAQNNKGKKEEEKKSKSFWISIRRGKIRVRMHGTIPKENSKTSQKT